MESTPTTKARRDAGASAAAYAIAGIALITHAVRAVGDWRDGVIPINVITAEDRAMTLAVETADVPGWAVTTLQTAQVLDWLIGGAVLVLLTLCVSGMMRGEVFTPRTARWSTWASWAVLALIAAPLALRLAASGEALHAAGLSGRYDLDLVSPQFWYLYVGMMTLSFLALVLRRGTQLQADQDGLI